MTKITDKIYGKIEFTKPVLVDLINSPPLQRLKKISQDGGPHFIQPVRKTTRYEHSLGVCYLSKKYHRSTEEQIASLLHDISHTAFSHVADFVVGNKKNEFHEEFRDEFILNSEISKILKRHRINLAIVLKKENFWLLENDLPDLSIDRLDYFLRDGYCIGFLPKKLIKEFLADLKIKEKKLCFTNIRIAALFSILFMSFSRLIWLDPNSHGSFFLLANAIKIALKKRAICKKDLFTNDGVLFSKLKNSKIKKVSQFLDRLRPGMEFKYSPKKKAEFYGPSKPRIVNPFVITKNGLKRISELVPSLSYAFEEFSKRYKNIGVSPINNF